MMHNIYKHTVGERERERRQILEELLGNSSLMSVAPLYYRHKNG